MAKAKKASSSQASTADEPRYGFRAYWRFLKPFWTSSDQKWKARLMLGGIVGLTVANIALTAGIGLGFQFALNALVAKSATAFILGGGLTVAAMGVAAVANNGLDYMTSTLSQNWRGWLTRQFSDAWLDNKAYLRLQHKKDYAQNPDQRISESVNNVTQSTLNLSLGLMRSGLGLATFSVILWQISPLMVGAAVVCAGASYATTHWTGGSMKRLWRGLMDTEAKFRHALVRVRDNAKPIALAGLEPVEKETLTEKFNELDKQKREFYKIHFRTGLVNSLNVSSASIVPIALSAPKFFAGTGTLGGLELARQMYGQFYNALNWFPQGYSQIQSWRANVSQLMDFQKDLEENKADITQPKTATAATKPKPKTKPKPPAPKP